MQVECSKSSPSPEYGLRDVRRDCDERVHVWKVSALLRDVPLPAPGDGRDAPRGAVLVQPSRAAVAWAHLLHMVRGEEQVHPAVQGVCVEGGGRGEQLSNTLWTGLTESKILFTPTEGVQCVKRGGGRGTECAVVYLVGRRRDQFPAR